MAKKQKRQVRSAVRTAPAGTTTAPAPVTVVDNKPIRRGPVASTFEFNPDYAPVIKDLKRIGILAGSFLIVLIALSFILN
jgi:hypothetical protein